ncbi:Rrf2 family transcriptional regulator [Pseudoflavonifractor sp. 60]|nr:Rrf2 family transcriptional regulator [Lawsonibacter sp.]NBI65786.1 Rrf2 family transcriptional regulator [Pseudoflavonifractor sp. 60]
MLMTREMDYALRIMRALYQKEQLSATAIAQQEHMPKAVTLKILKQLRSAGLVDSRRGPSGGYLLLRPCEEMNLWELFQAMGGGMLINRCQQPGYQCENRSADNCALSLELSRVQQVLDEELQRTPLSQLFQEEPD